VTFVLLIEIIDHCNFSSKLVMHTRCLESPFNHMLTRLFLMLMNLIVHGLSWLTIHDSQIYGFVHTNLLMWG
jgi:hypothetical protein